MTNLISSKTLFICLRFGMGITLIWASVDKILYPGQFADMIYNYKIMPSFAIHPMAIILPWLEFTTGIVLIIGFWLEGALFIFNSLMLIFIIALSSALIRGLNIQCGCFTVDPNADREIMISLVRDLFMFLAGMWGMRQVLYQKFHIQSL